MKLVIGLSGKMGSGKTVVSDHLLDRYGAKQLRFSKILMDISERLHLPIKRKTLQKLGHGLRTSIGEDVLVNAFKEDIRDEKADLVVIDGVRYPNEVDMIHEFDNHLILYIDAPQKMRYERCVKRGEKGEAKISFEEFKVAESQATEAHLDELKLLVDNVLENTGSIDELNKRIDDLLRDHM